ncbi:MAG: acetylxylan esterase [Clostridia bacterium]|nr:acetylxylan esterase [Clostridia bacterium]
MFERFLDGYRNPEYELNDFIVRKAMEKLEEEEKAKDKIKTVIEWEEKSKEIKDGFLESIGGLDFEKCELNPIYTGDIKKPGYMIRKLIFQSIPGFYVTANLYIPGSIEKPVPAILFSCGHSKPAKAEPTYQLAAIELVQNGMAVLCVDPPGQGEMIQLPDREDIDWGVHEHSYMGLSCTLAGMNIARYFIWDLVRALDFLESLDFVDKDKIGATGNSGGGTQTSYISLVDDRIKAAAPGCYLNGRKQYIVKGHAHDSEQNIFDCMGFGLDYGDFISCFAPKPFTVLSQQYDFFPIEGALYSVKRAKRIYALYGKEENAGIVIDKEMHGLSDVLRRATAEFFTRHFLNRPCDKDINPYEHVLGEDELKCTGSGQVVSEFSDALSLDKLIYADYIKRITRNEALEDRVRHAFNIRDHKRRPLERRINPFDFEGRMAEKVFWLSEDEVSNSGIYINGKPTGYVTYMFFEDGTHDMAANKKDIASMLNRGDVFVVDVRGTGAVKGARINNAPYNGMYGTIHKMNSDAIMCGTSLMEMRINDIMQSLLLAEKKINAVSYGNAGIPVLIAAFLNPRIESLRIESAPVSFGEIMGCRAPFDPGIESFAMARAFDCDELRAAMEKDGRLK